MSVKKRVIILVVSLLGITGIIIGVSYAFFSIGGVQETANTFTSGCLNISLTNESTSIHLTNVYPITDIEGLETTSYDFTVKNNCNSSTNYQINLESLNEQVNSLNADYIKVSLSSDTVDNVISILSSNTSVTPTIDNAYESYNLYTDSLGANEEKTYHLKIWVDYDATVEEAASKVYESKINVIANPETTIVDTLEAKFNLEDKTMTSTLTDNVTSASYCITTNKICEPNTSATISNNTYTVELEGNENKQMVCTKLNGTSKVICSNGVEVKPLCPEGASACNTILAGRTVQTRNLPFTTSTKVEGTNEKGDIYQTTDWEGTTYYFAGNPSNNWVFFGGYYWRIIRINGDGTIRMIYQGTSANTSGTDTQIQTSAFNSDYDRSEYVGLKYTEDSQHGTNTKSTILIELDDWYTNTSGLTASQYSQYIDTNVGFCSDREMASGYSWSSTGSTHYYAAYGRLVQSYNNVRPSLDCSNSSDILKIPVGLITADEVVYGGLAWDDITNNNYLYTGQSYWTMSPFYTESSGNAYVFSVPSDGMLSIEYVGAAYGVRPVINLKADTQFIGEGTVNSPFEVA